MIIHKVGFWKHRLLSKTTSEVVKRRQKREAPNEPFWALQRCQRRGGEQFDTAFQREPSLAPRQHACTQQQTPLVCPPLAPRALLGGLRPPGLWASCRGQVRGHVAQQAPERQSCSPGRQINVSPAHQPHVP